MGYGPAGGPRVQPPRPEISDYVVIDWRWDVEHRGAMEYYTFGLLTPNGRYEPMQINNGPVTKSITEPFFRVSGIDEEFAKDKVREFVRKVAGDKNVKIQFRADTKQFKSRLDELSRELEEQARRLENLPLMADLDMMDDSTRKRHDKLQRKSLWQEWRDKRAERKADKKQDSGSTPVPSTEED